MCSPGYSGLGCTDCIETHGSADNTVLSCVPCATSVCRPQGLPYTFESSPSCIIASSTWGFQGLLATSFFHTRSARSVLGPNGLCRRRALRSSRAR